MSQKVSTSLSPITSSEFVIVFGAMLNSTNEELTSNVQKTIKNNNASVVYMHPIDDKKIQNSSSSYIKYEVGSEEGICALLLEYFVNDCDDIIEEYIDELDIGYLSAETSIGEEEFEDMVELSQNKKNKTIVISADILKHEKVLNISKLLGVLNKYSDITVVIDPSVDDKNLNLIQNYNNEYLEEVDELEAYDGTVIYNYGKNITNELVGGASFARVAKISDNDEIIIKHGDKSIKSKFRQDLNLQGTIALNVVTDDNDWINDGYSYKQVKIEKVNA